MSQRRLVIPARHDRIPEARRFVAQAAAEAGLDEHDRFHCELAVDEACANVIEHGYGGEDRGEIVVSYEARDGELRISLQDWGKQFDPTTAPDPPSPRSPEEASVGGLGVAFIRRLMTDVHYRQGDDQGNVLVLVKRK